MKFHTQYRNLSAETFYAMTIYHTIHVQRYTNMCITFRPRLSAIIFCSITEATGAHFSETLGNQNSRKKWNDFFVLKHCGIHLNNWGRVTHICVGKIIVIGSDYGLSPGRRQAISWTSAGILLIGTSGTNFSRNSHIFIQENAFKTSSAEWRLFCPREDDWNLEVPHPST